MQELVKHLAKLKGVEVKSATNFEPESIKGNVDTGCKLDLSHQHDNEFVLAVGKPKS